MRKIYLLGLILFLCLSSLNAQSTLRVLEGMGSRLYDINDSGKALHPSGYYDYNTNTSSPIEAGAQSTAKINNSTNVAGVMPFVAEDGSNIDQAAYKKNGAWTGIGYFIGDVPESGWFASASAISENSKYVTGLISTGVSNALPFIFDTETSTLTKLTGDNLYESGRGYGVNDNGIIAAWIDRDDIFNTGTFRVPAYFDAEGMVHYIDFDTPEYGESNDVNNAGQVVGYKSNKAFIFDINTGVYQAFTAPDGSSAVFTSISDNGIAIGYSDDLGTREVIIYHPSFGDAPVFLKDLLIEEGVTITTFDGKLGTGMGISPDGKFICGFDNTAPVFFAAGWVVYLDLSTSPTEGCLEAENGQYPSGAAFVPACEGEPEDITAAGWTGEYSLVTVTNGTEYIFTVSDPTYFITIGDATGTTVLTSGTGNVTWTANLDGDIRFYTHFNSDCEWDEETFLTRTIQCGEIVIPTEYCEPVLDCTDGDVINNVTFAGINNTTDCSPNGYGDYTEMHAEVVAGETYSMSVTVGAGWTYEATMVWIDFNNDFIFDPVTEYFFIGSDPGTTNTADITIPAGTPDGDYRLRVRVGAVNPDSNDLSILACDEDTVFGETEDYTLTVGEGGDGPCEQIFTGEATGGSGSSSPFMTANDIEVEANTQFTLESISVDVVPLAGDVTTFDVYIYEDNNGPGAQIGAGHFGLTATSVTPNGMLFDLYPIYTVVLDLPTAEVLSGGTAGEKYWVSVIMGPSTTAQQVFWIFSAYDSASGSEPLYQSPDDGGTWAPYADPDTGENAESVMSVFGTCGELGVSDMNSFDFAYYPNPVKDELNITSQKVVQSVSVYNLAGQQISTQKLNVNNGKVSTSSLTPGVYLFRAVLEGGQVETFKVIKK